MIYQDRIYGKIEIDEPVILDLINCPSMQRLKGIDQGGNSDVFFPNTSHNRFEHSLGVFCLLKNYNASLEEQIAGLLHDVSHSAFSHTIDYVFDDGSPKEHCHQDNIHEEFVMNSEIPEILQKYNFNPEYILNEKNFPLKENDLPDICADRIDYSMRAAVIFGKSIQEEIYNLLQNLEAENNKWFFKNFESAKKFAEIFRNLNTDCWSGLPTAIMFQSTGDYLRHALQNNYITKEDLYTTDKEVLAKVSEYHNKDYKLNLLFLRMSNKIKCNNNPENYDARLFCKSRVVDPLCMYEEKICRVSDIEPAWAEVVENESKPKEYFLKFEL